MKKTLLFLLTTTALLAVDKNYFEIGAAFSNSKDNLSTLGSNKIDNFKNSKAKKYELPYISFFYNHKLDETKDIYAKLDYSELFLGSTIKTNSAIFDLGIKTYLLGQEWENPFLLGSKRETVETTEDGIYLGYGFIFNKNSEAMLRYEYSEKNYKKDPLIKDLKREGERNVLSLENIFILNFLTSTALLNNQSYENFSAKGEANSYNRVDLEVGIYTEVIKNIELTLMGNIANKKYKKINPILNKKINSNIYRVYAQTTFNKLFKYKKIYLSLKVDYEKEETNHKFYDKETSYIVTSIGWKF